MLNDNISKSTTLDDFSSPSSAKRSKWFSSTPQSFDLSKRRESLDEGYSSFQSTSNSATPQSTKNLSNIAQISPDSTNHSAQDPQVGPWKYSPEFLASVQTAMKIFQQQMQTSNQNPSTEIPPMQNSTFSRWNASNSLSTRPTLMPLPPVDSEVIIQRLLTQLRSNMLRMVDNSLAQIECSLRNQDIDRESLLGYLGQATAINLQQSHLNQTTPLLRQNSNRDFMPNFKKRSTNNPNFDSWDSEFSHSNLLNFDDTSSIATSDAFDFSSSRTRNRDDDMEMNSTKFLEELNPAGSSIHIADKLAMNMSMNSILTTAHLKKAKLMFLFVRYPNSGLLKSYFPGVRFNRSNTAQLIKWFSNFREFLYINVEKYVRQLVSEGVESFLEVVPLTNQHELVRVLLMHYNRSREIETPKEFYAVVQRTMEEFFKSIKTGDDEKQSWKKPIYKIIAQMDQPLPDFFRQ